jgi:hypothetical protein
MGNYKSKNIIFIILCFFILLGVTNAFAQDGKNVISLFEKQVNKFEKFFSSNPKLLDHQSYGDSPTGYIFFYDKFDDYKISYDIQKTGSLLSPYMGYITVSYWETTSQKCGDLEGYKSKYSKEEADKYFTTAESVRLIRDDKSCYRPSIIGNGKVRRTAKFIFAFQKKRWLYKDVVDENNEPDVGYRISNSNP